jgi:hypothetical protein
MKLGPISLVLAGLMAITPRASAGCMDTDNKLWINDPGQKAIYNRLMGLMACPADVDKDEGHQIDAVACNWFVAKALSELYGVHDFDPTTQGKWLNANEIVAWVRSHEALWSKLGPGNVQSVLNDAAAGAANEQPTIATTQGEPHGHVGIILSGIPQASTTWKDAQGNALRAPNSAAFSLNSVSKAYVFCRLSAGFSDPSKVEIYFRVKN